MDIRGTTIKRFLHIIAHYRTLVDGNMPPEMPSHGGNTGSNPVGDASKTSHSFRQDFALGVGALVTAPESYFFAERGDQRVTADGAETRVRRFAAIRDRPSANEA
jgi:hypothetical protein